MNLNQLKALDALEQTGSFVGAANQLGLTQPAVSIQLRKLQKHYGVKLFWRNGRELKFSPLGKELVLKARKILGLVDDFKECLTLNNQLRRGCLTIGLSCHYLVMDLLSVFMERYPGIHVTAKIGDSAHLIEDVTACRLDLAAVTALAPDDRLVNIVYSHQNIVLFVGQEHPWATRSTVSPEQLHQQPMVARHPTSRTRQIFSRALEDRGIDPQIIIELDSWDATKEAVAAGIGFGIALEDEFIQDPRLTGIRLKDIELTARQYVVCLAEFEALRPVQAFIKVVREVKALRTRQSHEPPADSSHKHSTPFSTSALKLKNRSQVWSNT